jgi:hypothetical protein
LLLPLLLLLPWFLRISTAAAAVIRLSKSSN